MREFALQLSDGRQIRELDLNDGELAHGVKSFLIWRAKQLPGRRAIGGGILVKVDKLIAHASLDTASEKEGGLHRTLWAEAVKEIFFPSGACFPKVSDIELT